MSYRKFITLVLLPVVLTMAACASNPKAQYNSNYDFSGIGSYTIFPRHHPFNDIQRLSDFQRNRIELAIEQTMEAYDFSYAEQEQADIAVTYFIVQSSLKELETYNRRVRACLVCTDKEQRTLNRKITSDMLIIDLISSRSKRSIYRQTSRLKIKPKNTSDENRQIIVEAVRLALADLPKLVRPPE